MSRLFRVLALGVFAVLLLSVSGVPALAKDKLTLRNGNFDGVVGIADLVIFEDGFESGDTTAWSITVP